MKAHIITAKDYVAIVEMAQRNGKKAGDSMQEEFKEYFKNKKLDCVGDFPDEEMFRANLREKGYFKMLDLRNKKKDEK